MIKWTSGFFSCDKLQIVKYSQTFQNFTDNGNKKIKPYELLKDELPEILANNKLYRKTPERLKVTLLYGCLSRFLNCTNGTKLHNASQI